MENPLRRARSPRSTDGRPGRGTADLSFSHADAARVVAEACRAPKDVGVPVTHWSRSLLQVHLAGLSLVLSESAIGRILNDADLQPHRQKMWLNSQDENFRAKRDDVLHVYYDTPANEHVISVDEKPGMQTLERRYVDMPMGPGKPVRREYEYVRHGTQVLMGALDVRTGKLFGYIADRRGTEAFLVLLDHIDHCYPRGRGHIVCDNLTDHDNEDVREWFDEHPRWTQHFTPKHASWLNQIECAFSVLQRRVLARGSFPSTLDLREKIYAYMLWHNEQSHAFTWSYRPKSWRN